MRYELQSPCGSSAVAQNEMTVGSRGCVPAPDIAFMSLDGAGYVAAQCYRARGFSYERYHRTLGASLGTEFGPAAATLQHARQPSMPRAF